MHNMYNADLFYPERLLEKARIVTNEIIKDTANLNLQGLAVCGVSGLTIGGLISHLSGLPLIVIRKQNESSHSGYDVLCKDGLSGNCCIVDDLIASGDTVNRMKEMLAGCGLTVAKIYLYYDYAPNPNEFKGIPVWNEV